MFCIPPCSWLKLPARRLIRGGVRRFPGWPPRGTMGRASLRSSPSRRFTTRQVVELKPNNARAIRLGEKQLEGYLEKLNEQFPGTPWTGSVVTYP